MTVQTREMAMGYILKSAFDSGFNNKDLGLLTKLMEEKMDEKESYHNIKTIDYMVYIAEMMGVGFERIQIMRSHIYQAFDVYTEEEAEDMYYTFQQLIRG